MKHTTCTRTDCDKPFYARGLCRSHYRKAWYSGEINDHQNAARDLTGQKYGALTPIRRVDRLWECQCDCGAVVRYPASSLTWGYTKTCGNTLIHHRTNTPAYETMHKRVVKARGKASAHTCVDCGRSAHHWSYNQSDPNEVRTRDGKQPYSTDISHYEPRCRSCHSLLDERSIRRPRSANGWVKGPVERLDL